MDFISELPNEILENVFSWLETKEQLRMREVSTRMKFVIENCNGFEIYVTDNSWEVSSSFFSKLKVYRLNIEAFSRPSLEGVRLENLQRLYVWENVNRMCLRRILNASTSLRSLNIIGETEPYHQSLLGVIPANVAETLKNLRVHLSDLMPHDDSLLKVFSDVNALLSPSYAALEQLNISVVTTENAHLLSGAGFFRRLTGMKSLKRLRIREESSDENDEDAFRPYQIENETVMQEDLRRMRKLISLSATIYDEDVENWKAILDSQKKLEDLRLVKARSSEISNVKLLKSIVMKHVDTLRILQLEVTLRRKIDNKSFPFMSYFATMKNLQKLLLTKTENPFDTPEDITIEGLDYLPSTLICIHLRGFLFAHADLLKMLENLQALRELLIITLPGKVAPISFNAILDHGSLDSICVGPVDMALNQEGQMSQQILEGIEAQDQNPILILSGREYRNGNNPFNGDILFFSETW